MLCRHQSGASGGGEDQEAGEDVAGAGLAHHDGVEIDHLQWDRVSGRQLQNGGARGDQVTISCVTQSHVTVSALHQLQTHLHVIKHKMKRCQLGGEGELYLLQHFSGLVDDPLPPVTAQWCCFDCIFDEVIFWRLANCVFTELASIRRKCSCGIWTWMHFVFFFVLYILGHPANCRTEFVSSPDAKLQKRADVAVCHRIFLVMFTCWCRCCLGCRVCWWMEVSSAE